METIQLAARDQRRPSRISTLRNAALALGATVASLGSAVGQGVPVAVTAGSSHLGDE